MNVHLIQIIRIPLVILLFCVLFMLFPYTTFAQQFPIDRTFEITGYYSPLPGQENYATGSYDGDIRLNGRGTNGASGRQVFPGMVAAPSIYPFGTKIFIPGIGMTGVYDRGGAIQSADPDVGRPHDRLDIWMGYGDLGLARALSYGRRTVTGTIYGVDEAIQEDIYLEGFSAAERILQETVFKPKLLEKDVWYLSKGEDVLTLQSLLKEAGYFSGELTGFYGDETRDAVFRFQLDQNLVVSFDDLGAGHTGPQTRLKLDNLFDQLVRDSLPSGGFGAGASVQEVKKLQDTLIQLGYDLQPTGIYDMQTTDAVFSFQKEHEILSNRTDPGAGYFGPKTKVALQQAFADQLRQPSQRDILLAEVPDYLIRELKPGDRGPDVYRLQDELRQVHYFRIEPTGYYGPVTEHAVFKFQQSQGLAVFKEDPGAGFLSDATRDRLNTYIASRHYTKRLIAFQSSQNNDFGVQEGLVVGDNGKSVERLQKFLAQVGFLDNEYVTGFFGDLTKNAVITFQKNHKIIESEFDPGAGRIGPATKSLIDKFLFTSHHG